MQTKQKCPHCGKKVYTIITLHERIEKEGLLNACEHCKFEGNDIRDKVNLEELYVKYNKQYFDNKLPDISNVTIEWSNQLKSTAGKCWTKKKLIKIGVYYHNLHPEELDSTLVHEMIHLIERGHGAGFKREAKRITDMGLDITVYTKYSEREKRAKWRYECLNEDCSSEYERVQRLKGFKTNPNRYGCPKCHSKLKEFQLRE